MIRQVEGLAIQDLNYLDLRFQSEESLTIQILAKIGFARIFWISFYYLSIFRVSSWSWIYKLDLFIVTYSYYLIKLTYYQLITYISAIFKNNILFNRASILFYELEAYQNSTSQVHLLSIHKSYRNQSFVELQLLNFLSMLPQLFRYCVVYGHKLKHFSKADVYQLGRFYFSPKSINQSINPLHKSLTYSSNILTRKPCLHAIIFRFLEPSLHPRWC